jgi:hypothetical protein
MAMLHSATDDLTEAQSRLNLALTRITLITKFVRDSFDFEAAKKDEVHQGVLLAWVLGQFPLIEATLISSKAEKPRHGDSRGTKRRLDFNDDSPQQQSTKRQRSGPPKLSLRPESGADILREKKKQLEDRIL